MRILVTGAAGFIGRHVLAELLARGHDVRALDSLRADVHRDPGGWAPPTGVEALVGDVRDPALVGRAVAGVEAVIHLAAKVGLGVDIADLPDYASSNDVGTAELLVAMAKADIPRLTLASSMVGLATNNIQITSITSGARRRLATAAVNRTPPSGTQRGRSCGRSVRTALSSVWPSACQHAGR